MNFRLDTVKKYYLFSFFKDFAFFSAVLVPFFTDWGGITLFQVQLLQSWFMFWIFVLEVPTGAVADKLGRKYSMALGGLIVAAAAVLYASIPSFAIFLLAEFFFAAAMALISGADSALLYDSLKETGQESDSKRVFGRAHAIRLLGILIAAPMGSWIAAQFGLSAPMLFSAVPFLLAAGIAWSMKEPKRSGRQQSVSQSPNYSQLIKEGLSYLKHHRQLKLLTLDAILVSSAAYFVIWLYQPLLTTLNVPIAMFGWFHAGLVAVEIIVASNFVRLEKIARSAFRYRRLSALATALGFMLVAVYPNLITLSLFIILAGGFGLTRFELMTATMNSMVPSHQRATVLSYISMLRRFGLVILNPIVGLMATQSLQLAFGFVAVFPLLTLLIPSKQSAKNVQLDQ